ncbi:MAG TPA: membrane protein insertase YidC [Candidatus Binatia bacterium]|jgi:YidC/Oxa1 family membrane protein insertase
MEKRALIAVALSLLILIGYQLVVSHFFPAPPPPQIDLKREEKPPETPPPAAREALPAPQEQAKLQRAKPQAPGKAEAAREIKIETDDYIALFTTQGARLKSFQLKHYRATVAEDSPPHDMIASIPGVPYPLGVEVPSADGSAVLSDEGVSYSASGGDQRLSGAQQGRLSFQGQIPGGPAVSKELTFTGQGYTIGLNLAAPGAAAPAIVLTADGRPASPNSDTPFEGLLADINGKFVHEHGDALKSKSWTGKVGWAGFGHTYFLFAVLPDQGVEQTVTVRETGPAVLLAVAQPPTAKGKALFIGPKELDVLRSVGRGLEHSINFGWFAFISIPLLYALHFFNRFTGSYGLDIILLTVIIKVVLAPLTHKSMVSMRQMQRLQPQMERLKERYKDDKEGLNKEIMELYRRNGVNPFGGCLPMLVQFPVFIGLYNALRTPIELRHAPFFWIKDLSRPDWESLPIDFAGWHFGIPILTLLMGASMFLQQWMTPSAGDPNQRRMMMIMPVVFTFMFINFPSGLTIYWLVNNLLSIGQQYVTNRIHK